MSRRACRGVAVAVLVALSGWLLLRPRSDQPIMVPAGARDGDLRLASCAAEIGRVRYAADCGTLAVRERRGNASSRLIALRVKRIRSPRAKPGPPVFALAGGPGHSNVSRSNPPAWLLARHDVVFVGYRGVDGTPRLECPEVTSALAGVNGDLLSVESLDHIRNALRSCATRLRADGVGLDGYTIPEVVEDLEAARRALGYERVHLLSESFGTRVAQLYAYMHPESLGRSAMIGVNPPGHCLWSPATTDAQLARYADLCRRDPLCHARTPDLAAAIRRVNGSMARRWLFLPIDPGKVKVATFGLFFTRSNAATAIDAYLSADQGDPSGLALMSLAFDLTLREMSVWGDFFAKGVSADYQPGRDYRSELTTPGATLGAPMSLLVWGTADGWPATPLDDEYHRTHVTDVETLLVSGSNDFANPPEFAEKELLPSLRRGRHVVIAEQSHVPDFWSLQPEAAERLLTSFYETGRADASLYRYLPMDFRPSVRFPLLAKIGLATVILTITALAWAGACLLRRVWRRPHARRACSSATT